ncbi:hypothetical protein B0H67DRAFT_573371 [Lasiosphaeris hirsuta]|uniref:Uncharacterized protein n=1 Tax=Lasiosphaeris hirsuta TaxID=260670 RepID=A0AA40APC8_9PEZI|nr:hypothetical protein B0H67DRAFT_573371 [Lasiosphaeris hirsuta]
MDIVILGFLTDIVFSGSKYPRLQLSSALASEQTAQMKLSAPGLAYYPTLETDIKGCQRVYGKNVLLSLGEGSALPLASDEDAITLADTLWSLFGPTGVSTTRYSLLAQRFSTDSISTNLIPTPSQLPRPRRHPTRPLHYRFNQGLLPLRRPRLRLPLALHPARLPATVQLRLAAVLQQPLVRDRV